MLFEKSIIYIFHGIYNIFPASFQIYSLKISFEYKKHTDFETRDSLKILEEQ